MTDSTDQKNDDEVEDFPVSRKPIVVGVGASAGGLDAISRFLARMPKDCRMSFVIIQHLDPTHDSALSDLLSRKTELKVEEVAQETEVEDGHVYVIPPNRYLSIDDSILKLVTPPEKRGSRMAIDYFFRALAADNRESSIGIILSGTGSDGTAGLKEIKEMGGLVVAQEPNDATHSGMPASAIRSGLVDFVLPVDDMAEKLLKYVEHSYLHGPLSAQALQDQDRDHLTPIFQILRLKSNMDFRRYRKKTVLRRIQRRMGLAHVEKLSEYLILLRSSDEEVKSLGRDILINVTDFFRDEEAWDTIESEVVDGLMEGFDRNRPFRVWVPGCASGEEAYSLAMLFYEKAAQMENPPRIQIFATDIAESALSTARLGLYPESISARVSETRLHRFFTREGDLYQVCKFLRDLVTFAPQNLLTQPPFSKLDFISCRNLLIYFELDMQKRVFEVFQFALREGGILFLGSSESVNSSNGYFEPISKNWRIYKRSSMKTSVVYPFEQQSSLQLRAAETPAREKGDAGLTELAHRQVMEERGSAIALVNMDNRVTLLQGAIDYFFKLNPGEFVPELPDVLKICRPELRSKLRSALYRARQSKNVSSIAGKLKRDGSPNGYQISVRPFSNSMRGGDYYLLSFELQAKELDEAGTDWEEGAEASGLLKDLEHELSSTREQLNSSIEEYETTNEELKASNEEAMSMNEELQSSNEELESSKEELQSLNEELSTLNHQLESKIEELESITDDLNNLLASTDIATLFLNTQLYLMRYTPKALSYFRLQSGDVGRPLSEISSIVDDPTLLSDSETVLKDLKRIERKVEGPQGVVLIRRASAYRTADNRIEGVVITFDDITFLENVTTRLERRERQQAAVASLGQTALAEGDLEALFRLATKVVRDVLKGDHAYLLELSQGGKTLRVKSVVGGKKRLSEFSEQGTGGSSLAGFALRSKLPVIVNSFTEESRFDSPRSLTDQEVESGLSVIIGKPEAPYGVLIVLSDERTSFFEEDVNFMQGVANTLAAAITRFEDQRLLSESEFLFRTLANNIAQLAWTADKSGYIDWYNNRWYEYTGSSFEEMKGWGWSSVHNPERVEEIKAKFLSHIESGEEWEDTFELLGKDGCFRWFLSRAMPIRNDSGEIVMWFGTNTDIEDQRQIEETLRKSDEMKTYFLATLAHELRNPLAPIKMGLGLLEGGELEEVERQKIYSSMLRQTNQLIRLVDDLMDVSRVSRNKVSLMLEPISLRRIIENAIETVSPALEKKSQQIEVKLPEREVFLSADETRLTQVFGNILSNAIRYSEEPNTIRVEAVIVGDSVEITITDQGIGLTQDKLSTIFDMFSQVDRTKTNPNMGLGIGLTLVKSLVEMHGGRVRAESDGLGKGSRFVITLPYDSYNRLSTDKNEERTNNEVTPMRILVVDDSKMIADMFAIGLRLAGHLVQPQYGGSAALEVGPVFKPDLIIMDIGMPIMGGLEAARRVRQTDWGKSVTLVAATGWGQEKDRAETKEAGFDYHLVKPVDLEQITKIIKEMRED